LPSGGEIVIASPTDPRQQGLKPGEMPSSFLRLAASPTDPRQQGLKPQHPAVFKRNKALLRRLIQDNKD